MTGAAARSASTASGAATFRTYSSRRAAARRTSGLAHDACNGSGAEIVFGEEAGSARLRGEGVVAPGVVTRGHENDCGAVFARQPRDQVEPERIGQVHIEQD